MDLFTWELYLKKFINFSIQLYIGTVKDSVKEKYVNYINLFDNSRWKGNLNFADFFNVIFSWIDVREQENLMEKALLTHTLITKEKVDISVLFAELILLVMNHYHNCRESFFSAGQFCNVFYPISDNVKRELRLDNLNSIFDPVLMPNIDAWTQKRIFTTTESSGSNGLLYWYFSKLEHEKAPDLHPYYITMESDKNYQNYCLKNFEILKKFKDFIKTIK